MTNNKVQVELRVGMLDVSLAQLLTKDHHLIEFPTLLLPDDVKAGSIVRLTCERDGSSETNDRGLFEATQSKILDLFTRQEPEAPVLRSQNTTQTSVVLEWDPINVASADIESLGLYKNGQRLGLIPSPLKRTTTKLSNLAIDNEYTFSLVLTTSAGVYESNHLKLRTHKMTDLSGITVCVGSLANSAISKEELEETISHIAAKPLQDTVKLSTTHFVCTNESGPQAQRAKELSIPIVRPEWLKACETERRLVGVRQYYLSADPKLMAPTIKRDRAVSAATTPALTKDSSDSVATAENERIAEEDEDGPGPSSEEQQPADAVAAGAEIPKNATDSLSSNAVSGHADTKHSRSASTTSLASVPRDDASAGRGERQSVTNNASEVSTGDNKGGDNKGESPTEEAEAELTEGPEAQHEHVAEASVIADATAVSETPEPETAEQKIARGGLNLTDTSFSAESTADAKVEASGEHSGAASHEQPDIRADIDGNTSESAEGEAFEPEESTTNRPRSPVREEMSDVTAADPVEPATEALQTVNLNGPSVSKDSEPDGPQPETEKDVAATDPAEPATAPQNDHLYTTSVSGSESSGPQADGEKEEIPVLDSASSAPHADSEKDVTATDPVEPATNALQTDSLHETSVSGNESEEPQGETAKNVTVDSEEQASQALGTANLSEHSVSEDSDPEEAQTAKTTASGEAAKSKPKKKRGGKKNKKR